MTAFPWADAMRLGLGILRLAPKDFWAMTPRELAGAYEGVSGIAANARPLDRSNLEALMQRFPDKEDHHAAR